MPSLYSYCIPYDDGAAPNPFWGVCTLVICKPAIRKTARVGDWIAGTGAKFARRGDRGTRDMSGHLIYAMKVTQKMTMAAYDAYTRTKLQKKIPSWRSSDRLRRVGDSIYDFSGKKVVQRKSVHTEENVDTDLGGKYALLSTHFYYFGDQAISLPPDLRAIAQNRQGHRRTLNDPYVDQFIRWIERKYKPGTLVGKPMCDLFTNKLVSRWCAVERAQDDDVDSEDFGPGCRRSTKA
jgi:Nucleotide modification associated domain 2